MVKNCNQGKACGDTCINRNKTCRKPPIAANAAPTIPRCVTGKHCGKTCIPQNKTCKDERRFDASVLATTAAQHFLNKRTAGQRTEQWGYPPPRGACVDAQTHLTTDIITLEDKEPSIADCRVASYFCNPSREAIYGGTRQNMKEVVRRCRQYPPN